MNSLYNKNKGGGINMNSLEKKELVSLRIPSETNQKLSAHVKKLGISKNAFVLTLLSKELKKSGA